MNRIALVLFVMAVVVAGVVTAWFFGALAGSTLQIGFNDGPSNFVFAVGQWWGAFTGLIAGIVWCSLVVPRAVRSAGRGIGQAGAATGACVGLLSTVLLHGGLAIAVGTFNLFILLVGLACGAGSGALVGAVCGWACGRLVQRESATEQTPEKAEGA